MKFASSDPHPTFLEVIGILVLLALAFAAVYFMIKGIGCYLYD
jgi:hypothetical protein